jgi:hypothetical protein
MARTKTEAGLCADEELLPLNLADQLPAIGPTAYSALRVDHGRDDDAYNKSDLRVMRPERNGQ